MDLRLRNAVLAEDPGVRLDVGIEGGRIVAVGKDVAAGERDIDLDGRLVVPGLVETHIHLDKSCILDRCSAERGDLKEAIAEVARLKRDFTAEDVAARATGTLAKAVINGTMRMRTHVEVDPVVGLAGYEGVKRAVADFAWALDVEICVFPQDGMLNLPGTEDLMIAALMDGAGCVGACPYTDSDPHGQIDRIFQIARAFDRDIDMHLDFSVDTSVIDAEYVCRKTEEFGWGGRVAIGHVAKLSAVPPERFADLARRLAGAGVAVTVLPSTDLFLMHRDADHLVPRGVAPAHRLLEHGVNCSLATNNVLNPFTPFGDCSLIRMANLYANVAQIGRLETMAECLAMVSGRAARLMNLADYGIAPGMPADIVVLDSGSPAMAVAELSQPVMGFKRGRQTFSRPLPVLHWPE